MKILQINSVSDIGSTGRSTRELAEVLEAEGHECYIAYGHGTSDYPKSFKIGSKSENLLHSIFFSRLLGLHGYGSIIGNLRLIKWLKNNQPDIIHLRNLHSHFFNYPLVFNYIIKHNIPVVLTLHDCFNFTGKCSHYTAKGCYRWKIECHDCPLFRNTAAPSWFFDFSRNIYREKRDFYSKIANMTVVAVSKWLMGEAQQSILAGNGHKLTYIYNWIDSNKFHRSTDDEINNFYSKYSLGKKYKYLISVSYSWDCNASRYKDAISLSGKLPKDYKLILVGGSAKGTMFPDSVIHIPFIKGTKDLSTAYSMANAYIHFSVEDTFGKVIAEAMSCGCVPITFDSTACGEVPGPYGIVVKPHDVEAIVESLPRLEELKKQRDKIVQYVRDNYDYQTNAHKYIELYKELLNNKK